MPLELQIRIFELQENINRFRNVAHDLDAAKLKVVEESVLELEKIVAATLEEVFDGG